MFSGNLISLRFSMEFLDIEKYYQNDVDKKLNFIKNDIIVRKIAKKKID